MSFPQSIKKLREKNPKGLLVQIRMVTDTGVISEFEGVDCETFDTVVRLTRENQDRKARFAK